ncbi:PREDICTED: uncharacterized protein LOC104779111 [Camelina sativa]|uniref:Uncharacterized protein LOC104779111 n=1 Tax=Camelina sativa TaxID=90675 RepID=A0ABM0YJ90_CAMSA|nr:PREDICTED: uncharacterized protein LOC104779111 [Camelina sativa]
MSKHSVVRDWVKKGNFQFGCLLETRVKESKATAILASVFPDWSYLTNYPFNRRGRIWVVWNSNVRLTPCYTSSQLITCSVLLEGEDKELFVSFVYAVNGVEDRKALWEDLKSHQDSPLFRNKAWMIFGDFNEILKGDEHSLSDVNPTVSQGMRDVQAVVQHCSFSDLQSHGPLYTWCNKREFGLICKKLDKVLVNDVWLAEYQQSYGVFEAGGCSDHLRCRIKIGGEKPRLRRPFKFCNTLVEDDNFLPMVKEFWDGTESLFHSTSAMYRFSKKLKALKPQIKQLSRDRLGNLQKRAKEAFKHLCNCQTETLQNPTDQIMQREAAAYSRWMFVAGLEEKYLKQKSKLHWLKDVDQTLLVKDVMEVEIRDILFSMPRDKSPGPDGYTVEFLKATWSVVKSDFITSVQSFFKFGFLPKGVNTTILALIPKDYRPISCCNVTYKVISKLLANRLKQLLPEFISQNQSAFVKDRLLMENVLLASEIVANYHKDTVSPRSAIKIDISKAFDSVQWPFLLSIFRTLRFPPQFIK